LTDANAVQPVLDEQYGPGRLRAFALRQFDEAACVRADGRVVVVATDHSGSPRESYADAERFLAQVDADVAEWDRDEFASVVAQDDAGPRRGIGVDIGGVVIDHATSEALLQGQFDAVREVPGAVNTLRWLHRVGGYERGVHLVSRCGAEVEAATLACFDARDVWGRTGLPRDHVHFVRTTVDKAEVARALGVSHFVDDRLDVLRSMPDVANRYLFAPTPEFADRAATEDPTIRRVDSWVELRVRIGAPTPSRAARDWTGPARFGR
jgi:hypothetical protein